MEVSTLSGYVNGHYPPSYRITPFPLNFRSSGIRLLHPPLPSKELRFPQGQPTSFEDLIGLTLFHIVQMR
jgi:hypothetical protein